MSLTLSSRRPVLADLIVRPITGIGSPLTTHCVPAPAVALGYNRDIVLPGAKRTWTDNEALGAGETAWKRHLTAVVGHWDELGHAHPRGPHEGLSRDEFKELLLQTAIYCGVPSANTAFKSAQQVFGEMDRTS